MKNLFFLALSCLSAQAAFAQVCEVDMVDRTNRVVQTFRAHGEPDSCMEGMKECRKTIRFSPQLGGVDCIRASGSQPAPLPNPYPPMRPNPTPDPSYGVSVSGLLEDNSFTISGRDASELYVNCLTDIRNVTYSGASDEIFFSANNHRFISASTSGWYSDTQVCSILEQEVRRSVSTPHTSHMRVVGSLEREPFQIQANSRAELLNGCVSAFSATRQGGTDELTFSVNGAPFQRLTNSGYWTTTVKACKAMLLHIDSQLR